MVDAGGGRRRKSCISKQSVAILVLQPDQEASVNDVESAIGLVIVENDRLESHSADLQRGGGLKRLGQVSCIDWTLGVVSVKSGTYLPYAMPFSRSPTGAERIGKSSQRYISSVVVTKPTAKLMMNPMYRAE